MLHLPTQPPMVRCRGGHSPPPKRRCLVPLSDELGKLISRDTALLAKLGWEGLIRFRQGRGDLASLCTLRHPARRLLCQYKHRGAPVIVQTALWTTTQCNAAIARGPHKSSYEHLDFLCTEFTDMVN